MTVLFGIDMTAQILGAFKGKLLPLTLHKATQGDPDEGGIPTETIADHAGEGVRTEWNSNLANARGYSRDTVQIIVLQNGIVTPTKDDRITIIGETYRIFDIERDPVDATWTMAGIRV